MKKGSVAVLILLMAMILGNRMAVSAAPAKPDKINSQGRIIFDNDTEETSDDVVFDAEDIYYLYAICE